jgi:hypothetical protein
MSGQRLATWVCCYFAFIVVSSETAEPLDFKADHAKALCFLGGNTSWEVRGSITGGGVVTGKNDGSRDSTKANTTSCRKGRVIRPSPALVCHIPLIVLHEILFI